MLANTGIDSTEVVEEELRKSKFYTVCTAYLPYKSYYEYATAGGSDPAMWLCGRREWCPRANPLFQSEIKSTTPLCQSEKEIEALVQSKLTTLISLAS
jgi:hypothetical protein